jgi:hypothetical protein
MPKKAMLPTYGGLMENTTGTNHKQDDKRQYPEAAYNKCCDGENAC